MVERWAPGIVVPKHRMHGNDYLEPAPNYWTPLKNSNHHKKQEEAAEEDNQSILRRRPPTENDNDAPSTAKQVHFAKLTWRELMQEKRTARKAKEQTERRRKKIAQEQEEALWAKRRLSSLLEQLDMMDAARRGGSADVESTPRMQRGSDRTSDPVSDKKTSGKRAGKDPHTQNDIGRYVSREIKLLATFKAENTEVPPLRVWETV